MIPLYVYTATGSIIIFAAVAIYLKYLIPEVGGSFQFLTLQFVLGLILHLAVLAGQMVITGSIPRISATQVGWIFLAGTFGFLGFLCYIAGLEVGNASVGGVVLSSRVFFSVPLAFILIGEVYQSRVYIFIIIAFVGAVLVSWQQNLTVNQIIKFQAPGMRYFLLTAFFWSLQNYIIRFLNNAVPVIAFLTIRMVFFTIFAIIGYTILRTKYNLPPANLNRRLVMKVMGYVSLALVAQILLVYALGENLSITETIGVFEGTLTFIFSILFATVVSNNVLGEQLNREILVIRVMGVVLSLIGTIGTISTI